MSFRAIWDILFFISNFQKKTYTANLFLSNEK